MSRDWGYANEQVVRVVARLIASELQPHSSEALLCTFRTPAGTDFSIRIWQDSPLWIRWARRLRVGALYDLVVRPRPEQGERVELIRMRPVSERVSGEDEKAEREAARWMAELEQLVEREVEDEKLRRLVQVIVAERRDQLLDLPASRAFHHVFPGGLIQHTLSVVRLAARITDELIQAYPVLGRYLKRDLVICGAVLHDLGKVEELLHRGDQDDATYLLGRLLGHWVTLQDTLLDHGRRLGVDPGDLAVLRHIVYSHQTTQRGGPADPQCLEGILVAAADGVDSQAEAALRTVSKFRGDFGMTSPNNPLGKRLLVRRLS